jgi:hypothetical protein
VASRPALVTPSPEFPTMSVDFPAILPPVFVYRVLSFFSFFFLSFCLRFFWGLFSLFLWVWCFAVWLDIAEERRSIVGRLIDQIRLQNSLSLFLSLSLSLCVSVHAFSFPGKQIFTGPMMKRLFFLPDPTTTTSAIWFWFWFWSVEVQIFLLLGRKGERILFIIQSCSKNTADLEFHNNNNNNTHHHYHHHQQQQQQTKNN